MNDNSKVAIFYILQIGKKEIILMDPDQNAHHPQKSNQFFPDPRLASPKKNSWTFTHHILSNLVSRQTNKPTN